MFTKNLRLIRYLSTFPPNKIYDTNNAIITLLDVSCPLARNLALILKQNPFISELRLFDNTNCVYHLADDLNDIDTRTRVIPYQNQLKEAIKHANIVVAVGGCQTKPYEPIERIFERNANNVRIAAIYLAEFNPTSIFCIAKPPVEALVPLVSEEYKKAGTYDYRKIIGVTSPVSMIANHVLGSKTQKSVDEILCPIVGGCSRDGTVAVISQSKSDISIDPKNPQLLQQAIAHAEDEVLNVKSRQECGGTMNIAPAVGIARFINSVVKALQGVTHIVECGFIGQPGHIQKFLPYMTSIIRLGTQGVESSHMPTTSPSEAYRLKQALPHILKNIELGQKYSLGKIKEKEQRIVLKTHGRTNYK